VVACGKVEKPLTDGGTGDDGGVTGSLELAPPALDFGTISVALTPPAQTIAITNRSATAATIAIALSGPDAASFQLGRSTCAAAIYPAPGSPADAAVTAATNAAYAPSPAASAGAAHASAPLAATTVTAAVSLLPMLDDFGDVGIATTAVHQYTLTNAGDAVLP